MFNLCLGLSRCRLAGWGPVTADGDGWLMRIQTDGKVKNAHPGPPSRLLPALLPLRAAA